MSEWKVNLRISDIVTVLLLIALSIAAYWSTTTWLPPVMAGDPGAAFFPRLSLAVIVVFGMILLVQRLMARPSSSGEGTDAGQAESASIDPFALIVGLGAGAVLTAAMEWIGSDVAVFAYLAVLLGWRTGRWVWSLVVALTSSVVVWFVFIAVLKLHLPLAVLPRYIPGF